MSVSSQASFFSAAFSSAARLRDFLPVRLVRWGPVDGAAGAGGSILGAATASCKTGSANNVQDEDGSTYYGLVRRAGAEVEGVGLWVMIPIYITDGECVVQMRYLNGVDLHSS